MWPTASYGIVLVAARALFPAFYRGWQPPLGDLDQKGGAAISKDNAKDQRRVSNLSYQRPLFLTDVRPAAVAD